ncbi:MAG: carboxymuconolactone decarboxylase family protein [Ignavibacterium sp.]|nr:carboxymuconolactone decarboxylase family protein [Ignavibacterium sp.]
MSELPKQYQKFLNDYPDAAKAYEALGEAVHSSGPIDKKTRILIKLAISAGAGLEGAVHSHTRKALEAGLSKEEIKQTILLAIPTIGFPASMAAMSWVEDITDPKG